MIHHRTKVEPSKLNRVEWLYVIFQSISLLNITKSSIIWFDFCPVVSTSVVDTLSIGNTLSCISTHFNNELQPSVQRGLWCSIMPFKFDSEVIDHIALVVTFHATLPLKCENYRGEDKVFNCSGFDSMCKINSPADFVNLAPRFPPVTSKRKPR